MHHFVQQFIHFGDDIFFVFMMTLAEGLRMSRWRWSNIMTNCLLTHVQHFCWMRVACKSFIVLENNKLCVLLKQGLAYNNFHGNKLACCLTWVRYYDYIYVCKYAICNARRKNNEFLWWVEVNKVDTPNDNWALEWIIYVLLCL